MFDELKEVKYFKEITEPYNVKYFKEVKRLKSLYLKAETYLEPKGVSTMELFCEYTSRLTIFAMKAPSWIFDWFIYRPPNLLKFSK